MGLFRTPPDKVGEDGTRTWAIDCYRDIPTGQLRILSFMPSGRWILAGQDELPRVITFEDADQLLAELDDARWTNAGQP